MKYNTLKKCVQVHLKLVTQQLGGHNLLGGSESVGLKRKAGLQAEAVNVHPLKSCTSSSGTNSKGKGQATIAIPKKSERKTTTAGSKKRVRSLTCTLPAAQTQNRMGRQETISKEHSHSQVRGSHLRVSVIDVQHLLGKLTADQVH